MEELNSEKVIDALRAGNSQQYEEAIDAEFNKILLKTVAEEPEREAEWLVPGWIPRRQITCLVGDGGSGKSTLWCSIAAAISSGRPTVLTPGIPADWAGKPERVMFFSAEDSVAYTLRRRLRKAGADIGNIYFLDISSPDFSALKFGSEKLKRLLDLYRPGLCIFDPVQGFIPPELHMSERNSMRHTLAPLVGFGEKYGVTFLIIFHTNKRAGAYGRYRMADSSDFWDLSRSVLIVGATGEPGIRYLSQEKSNYGIPEQTVLFRLDDERVIPVGVSDLKDRDYVLSADRGGARSPERTEAAGAILELLKGGKTPVSELEAALRAKGISANALRNAKSELREAGKVRLFSEGYGKAKQYSLELTSPPCEGDG